MFGDVLVQGWHWKKTRLERLSPLSESPVPQSPSLGVSCLDLSSAKATFKWNNPYHAGRKMLVWIIKCENGATRRLSASTSPASDLRAMHRACMHTTVDG